MWTNRRTYSYFHEIAFTVILGVWAVACTSVFAQNAAPSSHMVFDDNFDGDIIINQVRVPKAGEATYTYYEALGWRGKGAGYAGIQAHPKAHLFIFSIWDHKDHTAPIRAVHRGPGTETVGFGGEGTGLKSWNFKLGWETDVWYTLVARTWPVGDHTYYGFWSRAGDTNKWTHLVTMDVAAKDARFRGGTDAFIEDWLDTGAKPRTSHLRGGWKRKMDGTWFPFGTVRYSVNSWDLDPGKRSFNFRTNWNGGVQSDKTGEYYFMSAGGKNTKAVVANPSKHSIKRNKTEPVFEQPHIQNVKLKQTNDGKLVVDWAMHPVAAPQFTYQLTLRVDGKDVKTLSEIAPHIRQASFDISAHSSAKSILVGLQCTGIFDRKSATVFTQLKKGQK